MVANAEVGSRLFDQIYEPMYVVIEQYFQRLIANGQIDEIDPGGTFACQPIYRVNFATYDGG